MPNLLIYLGLICPENIVKLKQKGQAPSHTHDHIFCRIFFEKTLVKFAYIKFKQIILLKEILGLVQIAFFYFVAKLVVLLLIFNLPLITISFV